MIGVTIGIGVGWFECAHAAARRMEDKTGLPCTVIEREPLVGEDVHPSWFKHVIHAMFKNCNSFLYFDADMLAMKPWNPEAIFDLNGRRLCAVLDNDPAMASQVRQEEKELGIARGTYLNAGLFIFGREHAPLFEATWAKRPAYHRWIDQGAFNKSIHELRVPVALLNKEFNDMRPADCSKSINVHYAGLGGDWRQLQRAQESFFGPTEGRDFKPSCATS